VHVFDINNNRRTVLDERSFEVLHTNPHELPIAAGYDAIVLDDTSYVINAAFHVPERVGYALHRFGADGAAVNSFDEKPVGLPGEEEPLWRWLAPSSQAGHFWAGPLDEYRVDLWDAVEGRRSRSLVREADWFPPGGASSIWGVAEDSEGRLWIVMTVPTQFRGLSKPAPSLLGYRIEVLDPGTGRILAVWDAPPEDPRGWKIAPDGTIYSMKSNELGFVIVQLWHPALKPGGTSQDSRGGDK
jgi:hypothetical protein